MTLLNIGLRRYTLPPTQGWRQGGHQEPFLGLGHPRLGKAKCGLAPSTATLHHLRPCRPAQASNSLISQLASRRPRCCRPFNTTPPRVDSRRRIPPLLPPHAPAAPSPPPRCHLQAPLWSGPSFAMALPFCSRAADRPSTTRCAQFNLRAALGNARCLVGGCRFPMRSQCVDDPDSSQPNERRRWESGDHEPSASAHGAFGAGHGSHRQSTRAKQRLFGPVLSPVPRPVSPGRACPASKRGVRSADGRQRIKKAARSGTPADKPPSLRTSHEPLTK